MERRKKYQKEIYRERLSGFPEQYALGKSDVQIAEALEVPACYVALERRGLNLPPANALEYRESKEVRQQREWEAKQKARQSRPLLVRLREDNPDNLVYARAILESEGRVATVEVKGTTYDRLDGKTATPFQWLAEANKVLLREGLELIGRVGSWN